MHRIYMKIKIQSLVDHPKFMKKDNANMEGSYLLPCKECSSEF